MSPSDRPIRFAVLGLGHIAQVAVLPAFRHAGGCELQAVVSGDREKRAFATDRYDVPIAVDYDRYEDLLDSGDVDAVYVTTPNHLHEEHTVAAARRGVHVLCEKPMAITEEACRTMMEAARQGDARLMIAYRLHFDACNLEVAERVRRGDIGEPRIFHSVFGQDVREGDVRLAPVEKGGGPVYDMGTYCINAARYVFADEPTGVVARSASRDDPRFDDAPEMVSAILDFPGERSAVFTASFGSADVGAYRVVGTEGEIRVEPAYSYVDELGWKLVVDGEVKAEETYPKRDQFAPELLHLAACIREGRDPEPDGMEGMADVRIICGVHAAARSDRREALDPLLPQTRPAREQATSRPGIEKPETVKEEGP